MLLDPAKEEFDLPAALVERGDLLGRTLHVIGQKRDDAALVAPHLYAAQRYRELAAALADQADFGVFKDEEAIAARLADRPLAHAAQPHVGLGSGDEERVFGGDSAPPVVMAVAF